VDQAIQQMQEKNWEAAVRTYAEICRSNRYSASHWFNYGYALHQTRRSS
jgi:Flp pilus assembly protein TadD